MDTEREIVEIEYLAAVSNLSEPVRAINDGAVNPRLRFACGSGACAAGRD
jgi:hypothetical protein